MRDLLVFAALAAGERVNASDALAAGERVNASDALAAGERVNASNALAAGERVNASDVLKKNVLLLVADDLRPQLNKAYGQSQMVTPNLDKLAANSLVFDRAYTNFAICSASRNSFLAGRVPDKTRVWNFINHFRQSGLSSRNGSSGREWLSMPEFFKSHGYIVLGHGKMYHPGKPPNNDEPRSWTHEQKYVGLTSTSCPNSAAGERFCPDHGKDGRTDDAAFSDYNTTMSALQTLRQYGPKSKPWFIALGLHFPHQPWATPAWTVRKYPPPTQLPAAKHPAAPEGCPTIAFTAELDGNDMLMLDESNPILRPSAPPSYQGKPVQYMCPNTSLNAVPSWFQQQLRLGYYSAVTHSDWLLGMMIDELESLGVADKTMVVMTSDHGWQLGEHGAPTDSSFSLLLPPSLPHPLLSSFVLRPPCFSPWLWQASGASTPTSSLPFKFRF